ncbi:MAG: FISUMP domain-containing protein [bacterium]
MKRIIYIIIFFLCYTAYSQSLSVFNVDASEFPTIKANFFAFDGSGNQIINFSNSDFSITENGQSRTVTNTSCPEPNPSLKVSIAMSIDVSGSMRGGLSGEIPVELGKTTSRELCKNIPMPPSEFALQTCNDQALIVQDFTTNRVLLLSKILPIIANGDNDFVEHLLNPLAGLLNIAKKGQYKRVAILYTDAWWFALGENELQACKDTCSKYNIQFYAVIYSRPEAEPNGIKKSLQLLADATGGFLYDGITSKIAAEDLANRIQAQAQGSGPCQIQWKSKASCISGITNVNIKLIPNKLIARFDYPSPNNSVAKLEFSPSSVKILNALPGVPRDINISIKAVNSYYNINNVTSSNPAFTITPYNFVLNSGQSTNLTIRFIPVDSGYTYTKFVFENDVCTANYFASGGFPGKKPKLQTLQLIQPNGGEVLAVGNDTVITWEGVIPEEKVKLEYSTNNGTDWLTIADSATGLSYNWKIPKTPSNQCLARVTTKLGYEYLGCDIGDVQICDQIWMGCNLDVDHYRNGDSIPEVRDSTQWSKLTTGAWCYYRNDPAMGKIYGKLYNWYAVNDSRGLAPVGWHISSVAEWSKLYACVGDEGGGKLKSTGTKSEGDGLWDFPNTGATNESGFSAIPGSLRYINGTFDYAGYLGMWWTSDEKDTDSANGFYLDCNFTALHNGAYYKEYGFSVRCVTD